MNKCTNAHAHAHAHAHATTTHHTWCTYLLQRDNISFFRFRMFPPAIMFANRAIFVCSLHPAMTLMTKLNMIRLHNILILFSVSSLFLTIRANKFRAQYACHAFRIHF